MLLICILSKVSLLCGDVMGVEMAMLAKQSMVASTAENK